MFVLHFILNAHAIAWMLHHAIPVLKPIVR